VATDVAPAAPDATVEAGPVAAPSVEVAPADPVAAGETPDASAGL
jgi:hypothetical protein